MALPGSAGGNVALLTPSTLQNHERESVSSCCPKLPGRWDLVTAPLQSCLCCTCNEHPRLGTLLENKSLDTTPNSEKSKAL